MSLYRIDELFNFEKGSLQSSKCEAGQYNFITASADWKTHTEFTYDCEALVFAAAAAGSLGRTHYVNDKFIASDLCFILTPKDAENFPIDLRFYHLIFRELRKDIVKNTKAGTSKEAISLGSFARYKLPYFDIEKQNEIKNRFVEAEATKESFSTGLEYQLALVKELRQAYLREAMQGKLVPQDERDESAEILLEKIKAEKEKLVAEKRIRRDKPLPPINAEEIPFEIPSNWTWCRLSEIVKFIDYRGKTPNKSQSGVRLITAKNIRMGYIDENPVEYMTESDYEKWMVRGFPQVGDLLFVTEGHTMGFVARIDKTYKFALAQRTITFQPFNYDYVKFIYYFILCPMFQKTIKSNATGSAAMGMQSAKLKLIPIPLPPLAEQERIVAKLEKLMKFCDELEANIRQGIKNADQLLQTALKEALEPK